MYMYTCIHVIADTKETSIFQTNMGKHTSFPNQNNKYGTPNISCYTAQSNINSSSLKTSNTRGRI